MLAVYVSACLRTETVRENMGQRKSEGQDLKRLKKTWDSESLRKETLKNS
jgi:hypothetical protein